MNLGQNSQMEFDLFISHAYEDNTVNQGASSTHNHLAAQAIIDLIV
jgi:hypothetical protein